MKPIGSIQPIKKPATVEKESAQKPEIDGEAGVDALDTSDNASEETSLLTSMQILLRIFGLERSLSSIRDMADLTEGEFGYSDAVSALENLEFSANVGQLRLRKLTQGHCPAIATSSCAKGRVPSGLSCQSSRTPGLPLLTPSRANLRRIGVVCCCRHTVTPPAEPRPKRGLTCSDCRIRLTFSAGREWQPNRSYHSGRYAASPLSLPAPARPPLTEAN